MAVTAGALPRIGPFPRVSPGIEGDVVAINGEALRENCGEPVSVAAAVDVSDHS